MADYEKIKKGLECCQISMSNERPYEKCDVCPYNEISVVVEGCRSELSADALQLLMDLMNDKG